MFIKRAMPQDNSKAHISKRLILLLICTLLFSYFLYQLFQFDNSSLITDEIKDIASESISFELLDSKYIPLESRHIDISKEDTYNIKIVNNLGYEEEFLLLLFLDNEQNNFMYQGNMTDEIFFSIKNGEEKFLPITFLDKNNGYNNGFFLLITEPYNKDISDLKRLSGGVYISRFSINTDKINDLTANTNNFANYVVKNNAEISDFIVSDDKIDLDSIRFSTRKSISNEKLINFYVYKGNMSKHENMYAVIALKNWKQTDINGQKVQYFNLNSNEFITFPISIQINPKEDSSKELIFLLIENPSFTMTNEALNQYMGYGINIEILSSQRILIVE